MSARFPSPRPLALVVLGLASALPLAAQLASKSPFLPSASETQVAEVASPLEFGGYIEDRDGLRFRVKATNGKIGAWVRLNERNTDLNLVAKQHDPAQDTLIVEYDGRTQALTQRKSKIVSSGVATGPMQTAMINNNGTITMSNVAALPRIAPAPVAADAQKTLEDTAATIVARRNARALPAPVTAPPAKR